MKTLAIIAEYNPFHNGHLYMLNHARDLTGADYSIALMSGNFTQRGLPAICDKFTRAKASVLSGIDLCLELPFVYATGSAYDFANGAISILNKLNSVDYLCFGAENDDIKLFDIITDIIVKEPDEYINILRSEQKKGLSYPLARLNGILDYIRHLNIFDTLTSKEMQSIKDILSKPNNILAIEYLAALKRTNSDIVPIIIKRKSAGYKEENINGSISSAFAIRTVVTETSKEELINKLVNDMPKSSLECFYNMYGKEYPLSLSSLMPFIQATCSLGTINNKEICDLNDTLLNKLYKADLCLTYEALVKALKTKDITETRINRALLHLITGYEEKDRRSFYKNGTGFYVNILSFKKTASALIRHINEHSFIPVITKKSDFDKIIDSCQNIDIKTAKKMWQFDIVASNLYRQLIYNTLGTYIENDFKTVLPIVEL